MSGSQMMKDERTLILNRIREIASEVIGSCNSGECDNVGCQCVCDCEYFMLEAINKLEKELKKDEHL